MSGLGAVCTILGIFMILSRGPLIVAPEATLRIYRKLLDTTLRIRIMGMVLLILPFSMILAARGDGREGAEIVLGLGYVFGFILVVFLLIFTRIYKLIADALLDALDKVMLRGLGVLSVGIGTILIYVGAMVFR